MEFIRAKKIIQNVKNGQSWFGITNNVNIYRGCNQGCIYCDSRSSCYQVHNFDDIKIKENADTLIDHELSTKIKKGIVGLGGMSDPYNIHEKNLEYTRNALKSMNKYQFGVHIITKSTLVLRDKDILSNMNEHSVVNIGFTITTADDRLQNRIERNAHSSSERFKAVKELSDAGLYVGILMMPILPFINDTLENIEKIVELAYLNGAKYIYPSYGVTLRDNQRQYFFEKIGKVLTEKYVKQFGTSYMCVSPNHKNLRNKFETLCKKYGIVYRMEDIIYNSKIHIRNNQLSLF